MKKKPTKLKVIDFLNFGIFPGTVLFSVGNSYSELVETIEEEYTAGRWEAESGHKLWSLGISDDEKLLTSGTYFALKRELENKKENLEKTLFYIIITEQFTFTDYEMCKLAHEITHLLQFHLPTILDRNREIEAEAYTHTHLMMQCLKILRGK